MYEKSWEVVTGNCDSLLFLGGKEASTTEMISKALGKETIDVVSQNRSKGHRNNSTSINNSIMGRELMTPDELSGMPMDECVLMVRGIHPFRCHKFDIEKHQNYKHLEDSDKNNAYLIDNVKTLEIPSLAYNPDDHTELVDDDVDEKILAQLESAQLVEGSEYVCEVDVPEDEVEMEFDEFETEKQEPAAQIFSKEVSDMEDKPYDGGAFERLDTSRPLSFDANDEVLMDSDLFM